MNPKYLIDWSMMRRIVERLVERFEIIQQLIQFYLHCPLTVSLSLSLSRCDITVTAFPFGLVPLLALFVVGFCQIEIKRRFFQSFRGFELFPSSFLFFLVFFFLVSVCWALFRPNIQLSGLDLLILGKVWRWKPIINWVIIRPNK